MTLYSMKGKTCPYKPILCQEGFCQDCQIYLDRQLGKYDRQTQKQLDDLVAMRSASWIKG